MEVWWSSGPFYNTGFVDLVIDDLGLTINRNEFYPDGAEFDAKQVGWINALKNKAAASGEPLKFIATYWSPPARWKSNNSATDGGSLLPQYYDDFADYCVNTVNEYKTKCDVDLYALSIANEPRFSQYFHSCVWEADQYAEVIELVGDEFDTEGIATKTFGCEDMGQYSTNLNWFTEILHNNEESRNQMDIWAVHGYLDGVAADLGDASGWTGMYNTVNSYKKQLWMTETSGYSNNWSGAFDLSKSIFLALEYGNVSAWVWWQLSGDHTAGEILMPLGIPGKLYYVSKQYYRYIRPGAKHIESSSSDNDVLVTAYKHGDDSRLTIVMINNDDTQKTINLNMGGYTLPGSFTLYTTSSGLNCSNEGTVTNNFTLLANSVNTIVFEGSNNSPTINQAEDIILLNTAGQQTVNLSGITDGGEGGQTITVSASSSNTSVIPTPNISYTSANSTGTLTFTPQPGYSDDVNITLLVSDDGSDVADMNVKRMSFDIKVLPFINVAPTIDNVADFTVGLVNGTSLIELGGVSDGNDGSQAIITKATSSNTSIIDVAAIYSQGSDKIQLHYNPKAIGSSTITLTLTDDGETHLGGIDTRTITFTITVEQGTITPPTSIFNSNSASDIVNVYPIPATNNISITIPNSFIESVNIYSVTGQSLVSKSINSFTTEINLPVNELDAGFYHVILNSDNKVFRSSFIKQ